MQLFVRVGCCDHADFLRGSVLTLEQVKGVEPFLPTWKDGACDRSAKPAYLRKQNNRVHHRVVD